MSEQQPKPDAGADSIDVDAAVRALWSGATPPALAEILTPVVVASPTLLAEAIAADIEERRLRGIACGMEVYLAACPGALASGPVRRVLIMGELLTHPGADAGALRARVLAIHPELAAEFDSMAALSRALEDDQDRTTRHAGQHVGGYRLELLLGAGAFGQTWLAWHEGLRRHVALKLLDAGSPEDDGTTERVLAEARAAAAVEHPAILRVHEAGRFESTGEGYIDTPFVGSLEGAGPDGRGVKAHAQTLGDLFASGAVPARRAAGLMATIAEGVAAAHGRGVLHRDIKPANILLAPDGGPLLADFGLAQPVEREHGAVKLRRVAGTPAYIAPEVARGEATTPLSDVYSLGCTLRALLTGSPPRETSRRGARSSFAEALKLARTVPLEPIGLESPGVPTTLAMICNRATEHDPARRYASADQLAADLRAFLDHRPTVAAPPGPTGAMVLWIRRHRRATLSAGTMLALTIVLTAGFIVRLSHERARALEAERLATAQRDEAIAAREVAETMTRFVARTFNSTRGQRGTGSFTVVEALRLAEQRVGTIYADRPLVEAAVRHFLGQAALGSGEFRMAREQLEAALPIRRRLLGNDHPQTLSTLRQIGELHLLTRRMPEADAVFAQVVAALGEANALDSADGRRALVAMGERSIKNGNLPEARRMLELVAAAYERAPFDGSLDQQQSLNDLVTLYTRLKLPDLSVATQRKIVQLNTGRLGIDDISTLNAKQALGAVLRQAGQTAEAETVLREVIGRYHATVGADHGYTLHVELELAATIQPTRVDDAIVLIRGAIERAEGLSRRHVVRHRGRLMLGAALLQAGRVSEAEAAMREGLTEALAALGRNDAWAQRQAASLAALLDKQGRAPEAATIRAMVGKASQSPENPDEAP